MTYVQNFEHAGSKSDIIIIIIIRAEIKWHYNTDAAGALYKQQCHISHVCSHSNSYNWHSHVRSLLKDAWNSGVFICRLNAMYDSTVLTDAGRAFQAAHAAATGNVLPNSPPRMKRFEEKNISSLH